ncbi:MULTISPECIES: GntP family permease [Psychrobacter]|uniref:GntP family permease n=1 Tax=Psychrobacter communis TaxID=2762238 RepID=A0ABR8RKF9_9GAMM|nr:MULTISPECIES: GntP family permease [Psychrobacter]MBO6198512.1 GntP family permease [Psychrobacter sp.]MBD7948250.1 GntP family permease [Psychrobacter communis]MDN5693748.1 GntP family permease [Psychrobacter sp.]OAP71030.1 gluconate transporter [Psychrobacter sp. SHUES1]WLW65469.1 GntP family permease [Psychrobacter sp. van23A]
MIVFWLLLTILFIIFATAKLKWHPFLVLILSAFLVALFYQVPLNTVAKTISDGFGGILGYIGLVIVFGTIIGLILEKTGAAIVMAETVIKVLGPRFPTLTMSIVGAVVSVPVFCDSGYIILNSLKESLAERLKVSSVAMSVALATGLYATHTFVPPTPGPIAAAGNLGLESNLGLVIMVGVVVTTVAVLAGWLWSNRFLDATPDNIDALDAVAVPDNMKTRDDYSKLPSATMAFLPIIVPIVLICLSSIANLPSTPFGSGILTDILIFIGNPLTALLIGLFLSFLLINTDQKTQQISDSISQGLVVAAPILLITGAGGAFGAMLKVTPIGDYLGTTLSALGLGIFMPFIVSAALKTAQGSTTVALVTTSAMVAPLLGQIGLDSELGRVFCVMAIGAGAMTVSHANDSFFWIVSQFSRMSVAQAYKAHSMATGIQGVTSIIFIWLLTLVFI